MRFRKSVFTGLLIGGLIVSPFSMAEIKSKSDSYKALALQTGGFNVGTIQKLIEKGDVLVAKGKLALAKEQYDQARTISKKLLSFYRGLSGSFRGLDARIPREMDRKGRSSLKALAEVNLRLAALFRKQNQPEVAVPLLIEVVQLMTPAKPLGREAYQGLVELGFAETPYK